jgi:hypothetical protein
MKKAKKQERDELRSEYKRADFAGPLVRGKYAKCLREFSNDEAAKLSLKEDAEDLAAFEERAFEPNSPYERVIKELKKRGKI